MALSMACVVLLLSAADMSSVAAASAQVEDAACLLSLRAAGDKRSKAAETAPCDAIIIPYAEYGSSPTIGNGNGTSDPKSPSYGAMRIFIEKVQRYTSRLPGPTVIFVPIPNFNRAKNALRPGVQLAFENNTYEDPPWGFLFNSMPFAMSFSQMLEFLFDAEVDGAGRNGIQFAQALLDDLGGTQIAFPVVGSSAQGSGYFLRPVGRPLCHDGDTNCSAEGDGIGLAGLCQSGWELRFLDAPGEVLNLTCDRLVARGIIPEKKLTFYPPVGGESVLKPMQNRTIQGFEFVTPVDDLDEFFPHEDPDSGVLDCFEECTQNIGQIGARYAHYPGWHQPFLLSWMHVDKEVWAQLSAEQQAEIQRAARESVSESHAATESVQCTRLNDMLNINRDIKQREKNGDVRENNGEPVSAQMTMTRWPEKDLEELQNATAAYMDHRANLSQDFATVYSTMNAFASINAPYTGLPISPDLLGPFPGTPGCTLAP